MKRIRYVEIENFKAFKDKIRIELDHPSVLIGPNNAGKTTVIQALALWSQGIKTWYEKKMDAENKRRRIKNYVNLNRLAILEIPVEDTEYFWNQRKQRKDVRAPWSSVPFSITVGFELNHEVKPCKLVFHYNDSESIKCVLDKELSQNETLLKSSAMLDFKLFYPMSGIELDETLLSPGRINVLMGMGKTAQVLRNLCYMITSNDEAGGSDDWEKIRMLMKRVFMIELNKPVVNAVRGSLVLGYSQLDSEEKLDISLAGRGLQQMLLILAYLYSHKGSVLMIDEPDAHLEILREKQIYQILKDVADNLGSQIIIATHSEVILNEAVDSNLNLLINGEVVNLTDKNQQRTEVQNALMNYGVEHYVKAKIFPRILYVEGSTDIDMLKTFAKKLGHRAYDMLTGTINYFYTRNPEPDNTLENQLDRTGGAFSYFRKHFNTLRNFVPDFRGIAIFDNDGKARNDDIQVELAVLYWEAYELENYFINVNTIRAFISDQYSGESNYIDIMAEILDQVLLEHVFRNKKTRLDEFFKAGPGIQSQLLEKEKMSLIAEKFFKQFAEKIGQPILLNKGEFYRLIEYLPVEEIDPDITVKLDKICEYLSLDV